MGGGQERGLRGVRINVLGHVRTRIGIRFLGLFRQCTKILPFCVKYSNIFCEIPDNLLVGLLVNGNHNTKKILVTQRVQKMMIDNIFYYKKK